MKTCVQTSGIEHRFTPRARPMTAALGTLLLAGASAVLAGDHTASYAGINQTIGAENFGTVAVGDSATITVTFINGENEVLNNCGTYNPSNAQFTLSNRTCGKWEDPRDPDPYAIQLAASGGSCSVDVTYTPSAATAASSTFLLYCNDSSYNGNTRPGFTIALSGQGLAASVVNGACGTADGAAFVAVPETNLCAAGTAGGMTTNADTYTWSCTGSGGGTTASCSADLAYAIDVSADVPAGGSASCTDNPVIHGDDATCTATSNAGYRFTGWSGDCSGTSASCVLGNVTAARSITANFVAYTDPEAEYEDDSTTCYLPGCAQADLGGGEQEVEIDAPDTDTGNTVRIRVISEPSAPGNGLRHELTVLDALGHPLHTTRADSGLPGSSVVIDADADGRPRVTTRASSGSGAEAVDYEVQALADGSAIHKLTRVDGTVTQMTSQAPGTQTLIGANGRIESAVEDGDPGSQARTVIVTLPNGEGHTRFERYSDTLGDWETSAHTADPISPFEAGHRTVIEAPDNGLRLRIVTPVTRDLYF